MVCVLGTFLCTYVQRPTVKNCRTVTASLVCKYAFLKEAVSENFNITVWRVIFVGSNFRGKSKKALKINFMVLNFVTATSLGAWHCCISDDVIDTSARNLCY